MEYFVFGLIVESIIIGILVIVIILCVIKMASDKSSSEYTLISGPISITEDSTLEDLEKALIKLQELIRKKRNNVESDFLEDIVFLEYNESTFELDLKKKLPLNLEGEQKKKI